MFQRPPREAEWISCSYFVLGSVAIFLTVPFARLIQDWVSDHFGRVAFTYFVVACVVAALLAGIRRVVRQQGRLGVGRSAWLLAVAAAYAGWTIYLGQGSPEEAVHFLEYGALSLLGFRVLSHRCRDQGIHVAATLLCGLVGTADEILQWLIPGRYWDFADVALNASSAALMQTALWRGLPPPFLEKGVARRTLRLIGDLGAAQALLLALCASNTPPRVAWLARQVPLLRFLASSDDMMVEYGYQYADPAIGVFFSRFAPDDLRRADTARGEEAARILDAYRDEARYPEFLERYSPLTDPFVHEARVHLFRRDRFIARAREPAHDLEFQRQHCSVAGRENRILETYFPETLRASSYTLSEETAAFVAAHFDPGMPYESRVSDTLVVRYKEWHFWLLSAVLIAVLQVLGRRPRRGPESLARTAGSGAEAS
jgi:hypothetical protein